MKKLVWLFVAPMLAQPLWAADLIQIYREARENDAAYAAARSTLDAGRERTPQARAGLLPTLSLSGNTVWNENDLYFRDSSTTRNLNFNSNGYTLALSQPLFRWQNWVAFDQSKYQVAQAEAAGAYSAHVASKGIGGGSVEVIENTMALRDSLKNQLTKDAQAQADYDAVQTLAGIIPAAWQQQDMTVLSGNQSQAAAVPTVTQGFNFAQALGKSPEMLRSMADFLTPSTKGAPVAYPEMQGPLINTPAGGLGSGLYGQTDLVGIEFFSSTSRL